MSALYEKIGGQATLDKVVADLHKRIQADSSVNTFFAKTDMAKQRGHFVAFVAQLLEGQSNMQVVQWIKPTQV